MDAVSLWAATPHYLAANDNPKAMLALLNKAALVAGMTIDPDVRVLRVVHDRGVDPRAGLLVVFSLLVALVSLSRPRP